MWVSTDSRESMYCLDTWEDLAVCEHFKKCHQAGH